MRRLTTEEFIKRAKEVHGEKYDYSQSVYTKSREPLKIICPEHGMFLCSPDNHCNKKKECKMCFYDRLREMKRRPEADVWEQIKSVHGNRYVYKGYVDQESGYLNGHSKIRIVCNLHGQFDQGIREHSLGANCPVCMRVLTNKNVYKSYADIFTYSYMYLMEVRNNTEHYLKLGVSVDPCKRVKNIKDELKDANIEVLDKVLLKAKMAYRLEGSLHKSPILTKYCPSMWFSGGTECYSTDEMERLTSMMTRLKERVGLDENDKEI